jgi:predicted HicB family RNase H-like nuclease
MEYKGYVARVEYDDSVGVLHGRVLNTRDVISFEAESVPEMERAFREAVDDYLAFCAERGKKPDKPFSGKLFIRSTAALHRDITIAAAREGKSVNQWVTELLQEAVQHRDAVPDPVAHGGK